MVNEGSVESVSMTLNTKTWFAWMSTLNLNAQALEFN